MDRMKTTLETSKVCNITPQNQKKIITFCIKKMCNARQKYLNSSSKIILIVIE